MKTIISAVSVSVVMATSAATAQTETHHGMATHSQGIWEQMASMEPCTNGAVSASGSYPSQSAENMSFSTRGPMASLPAE
jgi:hypothetical protein